MDENPYQPPRESGEPEKPRNDWGRLAGYLADRLFRLIVLAIAVFVVLAIVAALFLPRLH